MLYYAEKNGCIVERDSFWWQVPTSLYEHIAHLVRMTLSKLICSIYATATCRHNVPLPRGLRNHYSFSAASAGGT
jgi:hypothetical protein